MRIFEIRKSINGEINKWHQGSPAIFIRFAGCNLWKHPCFFCDTKHALKPNSGAKMTFSDMLVVLKSENRSDVIVLTGGEPLFHMKDTLDMIDFLKRMNFHKILIETNGSIDPKEVINAYPEVNVVMDYKLKSSGNYHLMRTKNFVNLRQDDIIKFPVKDIEDLKLAIIVRRRLQYFTNCLMAVSPIFNKEGNLSYQSNDLINQIRDNNFILSVQIHKFLQCY